VDGGGRCIHQVQSYTLRSLYAERFLRLLARSNLSSSQMKAFPPHITNTNTNKCVMMHDETHSPIPTRAPGTLWPTIKVGDILLLNYLADRTTPYEIVGRGFVIRMRTHPRLRSQMSWIPIRQRRPSRPNSKPRGSQREIGLHGLRLRTRCVVCTPPHASKIRCALSRSFAEAPSLVFLAVCSRSS